MCLAGGLVSVRIVILKQEIEGQPVLHVWIQVP